jgi:bacteriophage N4 adsorption protein B
MNVWDAIPPILIGVKILLIVVTVIFFVSGIDDTFIDLVFLVRGVYRRLFVLPHHPALTRAQLDTKPEQPIAIMIPAWHESDVIRRMLDALVGGIEYTDYHVFVGTYPNDPETKAEVDVAAERHRRVHRVTAPRPGPTCKADCLNAVYRAIERFEASTHTQFAIVVMQDAEDVTHPCSLKLFNYLIPRKDMVQLPVWPLPTRWYDFTSGHYIDEFAESHFKNMVVRESLSRAIPSAGVGTAFSRRALAALATNGRDVFETGSLTEDYEIGVRLHRWGMKQAFVRQVLTSPHGARRVHRPTGGDSKEMPDAIVVREYFPFRFRAAVKQKSRWVLGITLQGWRNLGWAGDPWMKYMLFRDRKSLVTSIVNVLGYVALAAVLGIWVLGRALDDGYRYPPLVESGSWLSRLIIVDTAFLVVRVLERAYCVGRVYGWLQACLSVPRQVWGNVINCAAASRALYLFVESAFTGKALAWGKTDHVFPSEAVLAYVTKRETTTAPTVG